MATTKKAPLFVEPQDKPLIGSASGAISVLPNAQRNFYASGSGYATQQTVYQDAALTTPFTLPIVADANGRFPPIYLNPSFQYATRLFSSVATGSVLQRQADPINNPNLLIPISILKTAGTTRSAPPALTSDPDITFAITAAGTYKFEIDVGWDTSSGVPQLQIELNFTGTVDPNSGESFVCYGLANAAQFSPNAATYNLAMTGIRVIGASFDEQRFAGILKTTTAGTFSLQWGFSNNVVGTLTLLEGSSMTITRIA